MTDREENFGSESDVMNESHVGIKGRPVGLMTKSPSKGRTCVQSNETREEEMKEVSRS